MSVQPDRANGASPRRLLMVVHYLSRAGMEQQCMQLAQELARRGDRVTLACSEVYVDVAPLIDAGVRVVDFQDRGPRARLRSLPRLARMARANHLVHCTGWDASLWGRVAAAAARRPVVVTEHTPGRETQTSESGAPRARLIGWHNRLLDPITAATVVVAERQRSVLLREGVDPDSIVHIPNGVPLNELRNAGAALGREALGLPADGRVVVHVARFMPQKRQELTYTTMRALRERLGDVRLLFVGDGPERGLLERRAREDGADWVSFLGIRHDVPALLGLADLAVLPSSAEAMPMVVLEALGAGVPQVVTDAGDMPAVIGRGGGLVVPRDDHAAFERACAEVLGDRALAARLRREAMITADELDTGRMTDRYSKLFDAVLAGNSPEWRPFTRSGAAPRGADAGEAAGLPRRR